MHLDIIILLSNRIMQLCFDINKVVKIPQGRVYKNRIFSENLNVNTISAQLSSPLDKHLLHRR